MEAAEAGMMERDRARAVAIDDSANDRQLALLLEGDGLSVRALSPANTVENTVAEVAAELEAVTVPGVVLVDYRLDQEQEVGFKGGTVAAALREAMPDTPLVLFTTEERLRQWVDQQSGIRALFDWQLIKGTVLGSAEARARARETVVSMAESFARVMEVRDNVDTSDVWEVIRISMAAEAGEIRPFRSSTVDVPHRESASQIARWILQQALQHPGPLVSDADARAIAGLSQDSWRDGRVREWRRESAYSGVFRGSGDWYWRGRMSRQVDQLFESMIAPEDAVERARVISQVLDRPLEPDRCSWCGESDVLRACSICRRAVDSAHALRPLGHPDWSLGRVVCFTCILDGEAEHERFDESAEEIADMIRAGELSQPDQ
jgi:CheY-like chemotaxis protein